MGASHVSTFVSASYQDKNVSSGCFTRVTYFKKGYLWRRQNTETFKKFVF